MSDRPRLSAIVAFFSPVFGLVSEPRIMPLEDAIDYQRVGFTVLVDPGDEADLVRWEQLQRGLTTRARGWLKD